MLPFEASKVIGSAPAAVWARLATTDCWQDLLDSYLGKKGRHVVALDGSGSPALGNGSQGTVTAGRWRLSLRVLAFSPPQQLTLVCTDVSAPKLFRSQFQVAITLDDLGEERTAVRAVCRLLFHWWPMQLLSSLLPLGWYHRRNLHRSLQALVPR